MKHKHHIVPKHAGGTDEPENIVELTIEEHAEAHRILYEKHGKWQDKLAWEGLSKMISKEELIAKKLKMTGKMAQSARNLTGTNWYYNPETGEHKQLKEQPEGWVKGNLHAKNQKPKRMLGEKNGMYGKSAQKGKRWYNNGIDTYYGEEGTQPEGFVSGRPQKFKQHMSKVMEGNENKLGKIKGKKTSTMGS